MNDSPPTFASAFQKIAEIVRIHDLYEGPPCNNQRHPDDTLIACAQHGLSSVELTLGDCRALVSQRNEIRVIMPYKWNGLWVFDDPATGLDKEAFVSGVDTILDAITSKIPDAENGFICMFSDRPFPGTIIELTWLRGDESGTGDWYFCEQLKMEGWFCPALLRYFAEPPKKIYGAFRPRGGNTKQTAKTKHQTKL